jgi:hypothetical protein
MLIFLCIAPALQISFASPADRKTQDHAQDVIKLIELLTKDNDPAVLERARWLLMMGKSPSEVLDPSQESPGHRPENWAIPRLQNEALYDLGEYLMARRSEFPNGLPALPSHLNVLRLSPLIAGLSKRYGMNNSLTLAALNDLVDDTWLDAADRNGNHSFSTGIRMYRGELPMLLQSAEEIEDELKIIDLGYATNGYPEAIAQISPERFRTKTLAIFLTGAFPEIQPSFWKFELIGRLNTWWKTHPSLLLEVKRLRGDSPSNLLLEISELWSRGEKFAAWQLLFSPESQGRWWLPSYAYLVLENLQISEDEVESFCLRMPYESLAGYMKRYQEFKDPPKMADKFHMIMKRTIEVRKARFAVQTGKSN